MGRLAKRLQLLFLATVLVVAAFSTGITFLFFLVYLIGALVIGSYLYTRQALRGVVADYEVVNPRAQVGDILQARYRVENRSRWSKPWIEVGNESNLPAVLPGRVIGLAPRAARQWMAKVVLSRRGTYRLGALRIRAGDPFGFFTRQMTVGAPSGIVVFPRIVELPYWSLPPSAMDGNSPSRRLTESSSPLVNGIRPYRHGDALNRVHWLSSARHRELQVKEFELEQAADLWITLDLDRGAHAGVGMDASSEVAISAAASIAVRTLSDNRAVGMAVSSRRAHVLQPDRGTRMEQKLLYLLANVEADGVRPLAQTVLEILTRLRRGMTLCIITGSTDREWVRSLAALRRRGVGSVVVLLDRPSFAGRSTPESEAETSAVRHALAEYGVTHHLVRAGDNLGAVLAGRVSVRV